MKVLFRFILMVLALIGRFQYTLIALSLAAIVMVSLVSFVPTNAHMTSTKATVSHNQVHGAQHHQFIPLTFESNGWAVQSVDVPTRWNFIYICTSATRHDVAQVTWEYGIIKEYRLRCDNQLHIVSVAVNAPPTMWFWVSRPVDVVVEF